MEHRAISDELRAARHMFFSIGNMLRNGNANRFINFIEAAYITPVNKAQST
ncbi:hypothetical protein [Streptomyces sp. NBC_00059]|uniref:hypothetical protein n=1 Tax=Streptomyces sp. NBC_00059 TaxID=2975635 RepID=UPI0022535292|nr:hypothetical protein [Streptomyces sp. NBC_00059]MCX5418078.1 hypothetical protein [Streptomyces sp. NBC_00059]